MGFIAVGETPNRGDGTTAGINPAAGSGTAAPPLPLDLAAVRGQFPALARLVNGRQAVFFDGPAGSQTPRTVIDAVARYLAETNANHGGLFATSRESDAMLDEAHRAAADLLGADDPGEIAFGPNMTTLTFALSRALARTWRPGDEVLVTHTDHDANITPWVLAARDAGATVRQVRVDPADCTLDLTDLGRKLTPRTRLAAIGCASNASGTIHPVREIARMVHEVGGEVFLDAVHHAPHLPIDVRAWDCDYLACSAYKFFGPHVGLLWGRRERLEALPVYKLRPAPDELPGRWMTGTQSHEGIAGTLAAIEYLADLGRDAMRPTPPLAPREHTGGREIAPRADRRQALLAAYARIAAHERTLSRRLLAGLAELPDVTIWGIDDLDRLEQRVPTVSITHRSVTPRELAERLGAAGIFVWHGNYYALALTEALGLEPDGMLRIGLLHYNTAEEVERLLEELRGV